MNKCLYKAFGIIPDRVYLKLLYFKHFHRFPNLRHPRYYSEKIQWLKLRNRDPRYTILVDKLSAKEYVRSLVGDEFVIPLLGRWDSPDQIDFNSLPSRFVLKWNHDSGSVVICRNKDSLNVPDIILRLKSSNVNGYYYGREWPYKHVKPSVFAEQLICDENQTQLIVYKFFCFNGEPFIIQVIQNDKLPDETIDYYDCAWNRIDLLTNFPNSNKGISRPEKLEEMLNLSRKLSSGMCHVRIDLFNVSGNIFFSEFTLFPDSGFVPFNPYKWDKILGNMLELPKTYHR